MILQNHIYIMRHGQSQNNVLGIESCLPETQTHFGLTDLGIQQIQATAATAPKFDAIYSSPFRRTIESAQIIGDAQDVVVDVEPLLQEFRLPSELDQQPYQVAEAIIHAPSSDINHEAIGDGESFDLMYERLTKALTQIDSNHTDSTILLVSHGSPVEALIQIMKNVNTGFGPFADLPKNAEFIHLNSINLIA